MAGRFDISGIVKNLNSLTKQSPPNLHEHIAPDRRTRAEVREDLEKELASLDINAIEDLKDRLLGLRKSDALGPLKEDLENTLIKFLRFYDKFEDLNSQESRKVALKEKELNLEAKHDWKSKFRIFFFRILATALLVVTLFAIGYIESEYEWAKLPMSKYLNTPTDPQ